LSYEWQIAAVYDEFAYGFKNGEKNQLTAAGMFFKVVYYCWQFFCKVPVMFWLQGVFVFFLFWIDRHFFQLWKKYNAWVCFAVYLPIYWIIDVIFDVRYWVDSHIDYFSNPVVPASYVFEAPDYLPFNFTWYAMNPEFNAFFDVPKIASRTVPNEPNISWGNVAWMSVVMVDGKFHILCSIRQNRIKFYELFSKFDTFCVPRWVSHS
jgi:hypothetical protein